MNVDREICLKYQSGNCTRTNCKFRHVVVCLDNLHGRCHRGSSCMYVHADMPASRKRKREEDDQHDGGSRRISSNENGVVPWNNVSSNPVVSSSTFSAPQAVTQASASKSTTSSFPSQPVAPRPSAPTTISRVEKLKEDLEKFLKEKPRRHIPSRHEQSGENGNPSIGKLPDDMLRYISDFLTPQDNARLASTCTLAYNMFAKRVICFILDNTTSMKTRDRFKQQYQVARMFLEELDQTAHIVFKLVKPPAAVNDRYKQDFHVFEDNRPRTSSEALNLLETYVSPVPNPGVSVQSFYSASITPLIASISEAVNRGFTQIVCVTDGKDNFCTSLATVEVLGQTVSSIIEEHNRSLEAMSPNRINPADGVLANFLQAMATRHGKGLIFPTIVGIGSQVIPENLPGFEALHTSPTATLQELRQVADRARTITVTRESGGGSGSQTRSELRNTRAKSDRKKLRSIATSKTLQSVCQPPGGSPVVEDGEVVETQMYSAPGEQPSLRFAANDVFIGYASEDDDVDIREPIGLDTVIDGEAAEEDSGIAMDVAETEADQEALAVTNDDGVHTSDQNVSFDAVAVVPDDANDAIAGGSVVARHRWMILSDRLPVGDEELNKAATWLLRDVHMRHRDDAVPYPNWCSPRVNGEIYFTWQNSNIPGAIRELAMTRAEAQHVWSEMTEEAKIMVLNSAAEFFHQQKTRRQVKETNATESDYRRYLQALRDSDGNTANDLELRCRHEHNKPMPSLGLGCYFWVHHREAGGETLHERLLRNSSLSASPLNSPLNSPAGTGTSSTMMAIEKASDCASMVTDCQGQRDDGRLETPLRTDSDGTPFVEDATDVMDADLPGLPPAEDATMNTAHHRVHELRVSTATSDLRADMDVDRDEEMAAEDCTATAHSPQADHDHQMIEVVPQSPTGVRSTLVSGPASPLASPCAVPAPAPAQAPALASAPAPTLPHVRWGYCAIGRANRNHSELSVPLPQVTLNLHNMTGDQAVIIAGIQPGEPEGLMRDDVGRSPDGTKTVTLALPPFVMQVDGEGLEGVVGNMADGQLVDVRMEGPPTVTSRFVRAASSDGNVIIDVALPPLVFHLTQPVSPPTAASSSSSSMTAECRVVAGGCLLSTVKLPALTVTLRDVMMPR